MTTEDSTSTPGIAEPRRSPRGGGTIRKGFGSAILLATVVAHSLMSSSRLLRSDESSTNYYEEVNNNNIELEETKDAARSSSAYLRSAALDIETRSDSFMTKEPKSSRISIGDSKLPHWMVAVECSAYSLDCFTRVQRESRYLPYPFPLFADQDTATMESVPDEWMENLQSQPITNYSDVPAALSTVQDQHNLYPPQVSEREYQTCLDFTGITSNSTASFNKTTLQQLDEILSSRRLTPEPHTNMIAFTISDYSYASDMLHDMFQMMDHVVGFSSQHFLMVAIDANTVQMACRFGYPVVFWKESDTESLKDAVANTKLILSMEFVSRGIDFFFTEMDVWWIKSPRNSLVEFQKPNNEPQHNHLFFSGHQNNPTAPNIGVYAAKANEYSKEYFRLCLDVLKLRPETHDQWAMAEVHRLFEHSLRNQTYQLGGNWGSLGPPPTPDVRLPFLARYWSPHEIVADERPMPTVDTMAIHTLCDTPLLNPHGKKMIAKELGAYYGYQSTARPYTFVKDTTEEDEAGYYSRSNRARRRYLVLDGPIRSNFYSMVIQDQYHDRTLFQWAIALLFAIAKVTDRILILPQVFNADMDAGTYFAWNIVDYSRVNELVDTRESNFLSNPKSWASKTGWPFQSSAAVALMPEPKGNGSLLHVQVSHEKQSVINNSWYLNESTQNKFLDAFTALLLSVDEIDAAELLLINPDFFFQNGYMHAMSHRLSKAEQAKLDTDMPLSFDLGKMEREVGEVYKLLGWCWDEAMRHTVSKTSASHSCYGRGMK